ncbi:MAG TPA: DinB family protein [Pirellulaceae bacterium]|nr:DinB family protein [Pirellulaceae bacterium]HMO92080.1 DinB family protein [Pirellulaceae bacterium]HMP69332.1 DinB family protein [Pirellulaceae bacterium]
MSDLKFETNQVRLEIVQNLIQAARNYTNSLIADLSADEWFWMPPELSTHIAWQIGHLAYAQYGLVLFRQRGRRLDDGSLMSNQFRKQFAKGSQPLNREETLPLSEIQETFRRVFEQVQIELPEFLEINLDEPIDPPFAGFPTKYGSLLMCAQHEMLHAGQIGLIRRMMGKAPIR